MNTWVKILLFVLGFLAILYFIKNMYERRIRKKIKNSISSVIQKLDTSVTPQSVAVPSNTQFQTETGSDMGYINQIPSDEL